MLNGINMLGYGAKQLLMAIPNIYTVDMYSHTLREFMYYTYVLVKLAVYIAYQTIRVALKLHIDSSFFFWMGKAQCSFLLFLEGMCLGLGKLLMARCYRYSIFTFLPCQRHCYGCVPLFFLILAVPCRQFSEKEKAKADRA